MRRILVVLFVLVLSACSGFDVKEMFTSHVAPASRKEVKNLRGGKVSCLHCPMYFAFDATPTLVNEVIAEHHLKQVAISPQLAREVEDLVMHEASWWQGADLKTKGKIYWVSYSTKQSGSEPAFRLLVIKSTRAFFITSGYFSNEYYALDNA